MSNYHKIKEQRRKEIRYTLTNADIDRIKMEATVAGTKRAFEILLGLTCLVLHNSFGFGPRRCGTVIERMLSMYDRVDTDGGISLQELREAAWKYGGVK